MCRNSNLIALWGPENPRKPINFMEKERSPYELALAHYEFVSKECTEFFTMYQRSWSIAGSVLVGGAIIALSTTNISTNITVPIVDTTTNAKNIVMCIIPILISLWFVVTAYFWAYFSMYRNYLQALEIKICDLQPKRFNNNALVSFHLYRKPWFRLRVQFLAEFMIAVLVTITYTFIACIGTWSLLRGTQHYVDRWILMGIYFLILILSVASVLILLCAAPKYKQIED